jgi:hypothetical protein
LSRFRRFFRFSLAGVFWFLLFTVGPVGGETNRTTGLSASWDAESARVGDTVILNLDYQLPRGARLPEDVSVDGLEGLTVLSVKTGPESVRVELLADRLETLTTGPLKLAYLDQEGKRGLLSAEPVSLEVLSNLGERPEEAQLKPIRGIVPTGRGWVAYLFWGAGAAVVLLAVGGVVWWRRRRQSIDRLNAELWDPPHIWARKALDHLELGDTNDRGQVKAYYFRLSEIMRRYVGAIRGYPAVELTTEEIAVRLHREEDRQLVDLLRQLDVVKFADVVPDRMRREEHVGRAYAYIDETAPADEGLEAARQGAVSGPLGESRRERRMRGEQLGQ